MAKVCKISPCLWFDSQAEPAAKFYVSIFDDAGIDAVAYYGKEGFEQHRRKQGTVMTVAFHLAGQSFLGLNGGPIFKFSEAISMQVTCETQAEIDYFWKKLGRGGEEGPCGWLKDKFGLSWQITPAFLPAMMTDPDMEKRDRVMRAFLGMKKLDIATIRRAYAGSAQRKLLQKPRRRTRG
jgi:predicted 3-demethylubiquinone-9 3-methyltransferase (glyoxalase superfamily)